MNIFTKILGWFTVIGAFVSSILFFLFRQGKDDNKEKEEELKHQEEKIKEQAEIIKFQEDVNNTNKEIEKSNEKEFEEATSDNKLDNFNDCISILQK